MQSPGIDVLALAAGDVQRYHCDVFVGVGDPVNVAVPVSVSPSSGVVSLIDAAALADGAEVEYATKFVAPSLTKSGVG